MRAWSRTRVAPPCSRPPAREAFRMAAGAAFLRRLRRANAMSCELRRERAPLPVGQRAKQLTRRDGGQIWAHAARRLFGRERRAV